MSSWSSDFLKWAQCWCWINGPMHNWTCGKRMSVIFWVRLPSSGRMPWRLRKQEQIEPGHAKGPDGPPPLRQVCHAVWFSSVTDIGLIRKYEPCPKSLLQTANWQLLILTTDLVLFYKLSIGLLRLGFIGLPLNKTVFTSVFIRDGFLSSLFRSIK